MITLETDRLVIRNFCLDDAEALQEVISQYQASEYAIYDHPWPTALEKIKEIVAWFAQRDSFLAVCLKDTGRVHRHGVAQS